MQKSMEEVEATAGFYDYLEVHPKEVYSHLIERELIRDEWNLEDVIRKLVKVSRKLEIPLVATGNVHYLDETDAIFRQVLIGSQGGANPLNRHKLPKVHFRTTNDMLDAFEFLGEETAREIVIKNSNKIADMIETVKPIKDDLYTPKIEGADEEVRELSYSMAHKIYGPVLPEIVEARIEKELKSIIGHGFAVIYLISHKLVKRSLDDGYLVGSRGSVGSSLVATLTEITEVNPLPPHYICSKCKKSEFFDDGSVGSGFDLPDKNCPDCNIPFQKEGQDIPFETFLGFKGDKVPDIDLNFSGDYQARAHNYTKELFGEDNVFRAGTIGTVAEKTAYGYVRGYANDRDMTLRGAEIDRLVQGCSGVKRSTGQHPGGIIVVPDYMDIYDFSPIQFPADAQDSEWKTTHFDFHSIHDNLLKLDILGHDDPTVIRMLQDLSGIDPKTIPTDDPEVMKIFSGVETLGVTEKQIGCKTGTLGIPEFGTRFVRQMLEETKPTTFSELVQISGLSHGTDVWLSNAQELIQNGTCQLSDVIGCRDDIMVYLIYQGLESSLAFKIMESVRKGKGLTPEMEEAMKKEGVPNWYIESCKKIKYMFPKAHAAAYVLMAVRIAYFKVHFPILYYAAYFTVRAEDFDVNAMAKGSSSIRAKVEEINSKGLEASTKEKNLMTVMELALEMVERGFTFQKVDLYKSSADEFIIDGTSLIPPFNAIPGLGTNAAKSIVAAREHGTFLSKEDLQQRGRVSKTIIEYMDDHGCLEGMPDANQLSLF
jgi:DNA polymerase-3 subunit alpha (Gram-positive type)